MTRIDSSTASTSASQAPVGNTFQDLELDVFLDLMLAELQSQDPLDPVDNSELLQQISQIREISASDKLSKTLDSVLLGQNVATAAGMIDTKVEGISEEGQRVTGAVRHVTINDGEPVLEVAIATDAEAAGVQGAIEEGRYSYEVVWETEDATFSVAIPAVDTSSFGDDFEGSIRLVNLPETGVSKRVYRTDNTGSGDLQLLGQINGKTTQFVDARHDSELGAQKLTGSRQQIAFAAAASVRLSNISTVETLQ